MAFRRHFKKFGKFRRTFGGKRVFQKKIQKSVKRMKNSMFKKKVKNVMKANTEKKQLFYDNPNPEITAAFSSVNSSSNQSQYIDLTMIANNLIFGQLSTLPVSGATASLQNVSYAIPIGNKVQIHYIHMVGYLNPGLETVAANSPVYTDLEYRESIVTPRDPFNFATKLATPSNYMPSQFFHDWMKTVGHVKNRYFTIGDPVTGVGSAGEPQQLNTKTSLKKIEHYFHYKNRILQRDELPAVPQGAQPYTTANSYYEKGDQFYFLGPNTVNEEDTATFNYTLNVCWSNCQ